MGLFPRFVGPRLALLFVRAIVGAIILGSLGSFFKRQDSFPGLFFSFALGNLLVVHEGTRPVAHWTLFGIHVLGGLQLFPDTMISIGPAARVLVH